MSYEQIVADSEIILVEQEESQLTLEMYHNCCRFAAAE